MILIDSIKQLQQLYDENKDYKRKINKLSKILGRTQLNDLLNTNRIQDNKRKER